MLALIIQGLTLGLSAAASPGPFQAFLLSRTLAHGWRRTLPLIAAPLLSDGPIILLVLVVLTRIPAWFLELIQLGGGLFLVYLAWVTFRAARAPETTASPPAGGGLLNAALVNGLGPGPWLYWSLITGPILLDAARRSTLWAAGFMLAFYAGNLGLNAVLVLLFGTARQLGPRARRGLAFASAAALLGFGVYQLLSGLLAVAASGPGALSAPAALV